MSTVIGLGATAGWIWFACRDPATIPSWTIRMAFVLLAFDSLTNALAAAGVLPLFQR